MKYMFCYYDILSFITYAPCCNVFIKGAKFEILPKGLDLSRMEVLIVNSFCILMTALNTSTT